MNQISRAPCVQLTPCLLFADVPRFVCLFFVRGAGFPLLGVLLLFLLLSNGALEIRKVQGYPREVLPTEEGPRCHSHLRPRTERCEGERP